MIRDCRGCSLRQQCQWHGEATTKPRRGSRLLHPLQIGPAPLLWRNWSRREHRRACMQLVRHQRIEVSLPPSAAASLPTVDVILSRAQRAHSRLSWTERLAMRGIQELPRSRSSCSASQKALLPRSGWRREPRLNTALIATTFLLLGQLCFSSGTPRPVFLPVPRSFHLLPFLLSIPLSLPSLGRGAFRSGWLPST